MAGNGKDGIACLRREANHPLQNAGLSAYRPGVGVKHCFYEAMTTDNQANECGVTIGLPNSTAHGRCGDFQFL